MAADPGRAIPRASASAFIVDAVPIVLQCPTDGALEDCQQLPFVMSVLEHTLERCNQPSPPH
jgi:hypothetical protein